MKAFINGESVTLNEDDVAVLEGVRLARIKTPQQNLDQERAGMRMSREKFAVLAAGQEWITEDDAEAWVAGNSIPSVALTAINSRPEAERFKLRLSVRSQAIIRRNDMLIGVLMALKSVSATDMDELFRNT